MDDVDNTSGDFQQPKRCEICHRSFARAEHLTRHRRIHTKEKPFTCPHCRRSFQRSDVKAAHVRKCDAAPSNLSREDDDGARKRARVACESCRRRKMRCDGNQPCAKCVATHSDCEYSAPAGSSVPGGSLTGRSPTGSEQAAGEFELIAGVPVTVPSIPGNPALQPSAMLDEADLTGSLTGQTTVLTTMGNGDGNVLHFELAGPTSSLRDSIGHGPAMPTPPEDDFFQCFIGEGMEDWQTASLNAPFWFDESDSTWSNTFLDANPPSADHNIPTSIQGLVARIQEYFDAKSDGPSLRASHMWYSAPPKLKDHNEDIVEVFLNVFRKHIPQTFALFRDTSCTRTGWTAYILAMAAVGGLFCTVSGSFEVSKLIYNDARRLLLASRVNGQQDVCATPEDKLVIVKTFVLLAIYGLCSGDKGSYEFTEGFQAHLINSAQEYFQMLRDPNLNQNAQGESPRLLETLYILDCYRLIIMQCPLSPAWDHPEASAHPSMSNRVSQLQRLTEGSHATTSDAMGSSLASLVCVTPFLWPSIYPRQNRYGNNDILVENVSLWKDDLVEVACDKWLRSHDHPTASDLAVYHMIHIMLHANLTVVQSFVYSTPDSKARDPKDSLVAAEIHSWTQSRHFTIAHWHAEHMLTAIEDGLSTTISHSQQSGLQRTSTIQPRRLPFEAPHIPYAIYFATLIIWCGATTNETSCSTSSTQATIVRGERTLSLQRMHVAQLLARALSEVK